VRPRPVAFRVGAFVPPKGEPACGAGSAARTGAVRHGRERGHPEIRSSGTVSREYPWGVSPFAVVLLIAAAVVLAAAEWPRLQRKLGTDARSKRAREKRKRQWRVVRSESDSESDEFARAVERDLAALPTTDDRDAGQKKR
jgi:hypothetical protein